MMAAITEVVAGAETIRAYDAGAGLRGGMPMPSITRGPAPRSGPAIIGALLFPSGELFSMLTVSARHPRRRGPRARRAG